MTKRRRTFFILTTFIVMSWIVLNCCWYTPMGWGPDGYRNRWFGRPLRFVFWEQMPSTGTDRLHDFEPAPLLVDLAAWIVPIVILWFVFRDRKSTHS
jgi:hypothetical protein